VMCVYVGFQVVLCPCAERYGTDRVMGWACTTSAVTALGCALAPTFGTLTAARFVAGATCAAIVPLSMAWIGDVLPYERRQPVLARFLIGQMLGFSAGSLLGGLGAEHFGIHTPFVFLALCFAGAAAIVFAMPRRLNPPGLAQTKGASLATLPTGIA